MQIPKFINRIGRTVTLPALLTTLLTPFALSFSTHPLLTQLCLPVGSSYGTTDNKETSAKDLRAELTRRAYHLRRALNSLRPRTCKSFSSVRISSVVAGCDSKNAARPAGTFASSSASPNEYLHRKICSAGAMTCRVGARKLKTLTFLAFPSLQHPRSCGSNK